MINLSSNTYFKPRTGIEFDSLDDAWMFWFNKKGKLDSYIDNIILTNAKELVVQHHINTFFVRKVCAKKTKEIF